MQSSRKFFLVSVLVVVFLGFQTLAEEVSSSGNANVKGANDLVKENEVLLSALRETRQKLQAAEEKVDALEKAVSGMRKQIVEIEMQSCQSSDVNPESPSEVTVSTSEPSKGSKRGVAANEAEPEDGTPLYTVVNVETDGKQTAYRLYVVTYTTDLEKRPFCILAASAVSRGYKLNVLGSKRQKQFSKDSFLDKTWAFAAFLHRIPDLPDTIVVFVDAYDVLFAASPKALVKMFVATGKHILFSAERGCAVEREALSRADGSCDARWPPPDMATMTPWLNSGAFAALLPAARDLLALARDEHDQYLEVVRAKGLRNPYYMGGDQALYGHLWAHGRSGGELVRDRLRFGLDYGSRVFVCMYQVELGRGLQFSKEGRAMAVPAGACTRNRFSQQCQEALHARNVSYPAVIHFNGDKEKALLEVAAAMMKWRGRPSQDDLWTTSLWDEDALGLVSLRGACGRHADDLACAPTVGECLNRSVTGAQSST